VVVGLIEHNKLLGRVLVSSFSRRAIQCVRELDPRVPIGFLYDSNPFVPLRPWPRELARPEALHPNHRMLSRAYVRWAKRRGYRIHTWTVDDPARMRQLVDWGVEIIITNRPDVLGQVLAKQQIADGG
jgi:glycerophosphoryl diester phosphodiesterase